MKVKQNNSHFEFDLSSLELSEEVLMKIQEGIQSTVMTELAQIELDEVSGGAALKKLPTKPTKPVRLGMKPTKPVTTMGMRPLPKPRPKPITPK